MGCGASTPDKGDRDRSYQIDKQIEEDSKKFQKECKILLLGASVAVPPPSPSSGLWAAEPACCTPALCVGLAVATGATRAV